MSRQIVLLGTLLLHCWLGRAAFARETRKETLTTEQVRASLRESQSRIRAFYAEYEVNGSVDLGNPPGGYVHKIVAAKHPDSFFLWVGHGTPDLPWRDDPFQHCEFSISGHFYGENPLNLIYDESSSSSDAPLPGTLEHEFIFLALGWWPFEKRPPPRFADRSTSFALSDVAKSALYQVRQAQELCDGRWCHVLEYPRHDILWLDCERGCSLMAREIYDSRKDVRRQRFELSDFRNVNDGIYAPFAIRNKEFDVNATADAATRQPLLNSLVRILELRINDDVHDHVFEFNRLPGAIRRLTERKYEQVVAGGSDHLERVAGWMAKHASYPQTLGPNGRGFQDVGSYIDVGLSVTAVVLLAAIAIDQRRLRRKRLGDASGGQ